MGLGEKNVKTPERNVRKSNLFPLSCCEQNARKKAVNFIIKWKTSPSKLKELSNN